MAARRLIIVLLLLLGVSVVAAQIAPDRQGAGLIGQADTTTTTTATTTTRETTATEEPAGGSGRSGESETARIEASARAPETVRAISGDQLQLYVASDEVRVLELPDFGTTETAVDGSPASFNLLLREPGRFAVVDAGTGDVVGRLVVRDRRGN